MFSDSGIGFLKCSLGPSMRLVGYPWRNVKSCSGHSPPLSQTGQSSGWLTSSNSRMSARACTAMAVCVRTTMPSITGVVHAVCGRGGPGENSTRQSRHAPTGSSSWWQQKTAISTPPSLAASTTSVPAGTARLWPSIVTFTSGMGDGSLHGADVVQAVFLVLVSEVPHGRLDHPTRCVAQPTEAAAVLEAVGDPLEDPELDLRALAGEDSLVRAYRPVATHAAGCALAA